MRRRPSRLTGRCIVAVAALWLGGSLGIAYSAQDLMQTWQAASTHDPIYAAARAQHRAMQEAVPQARALVLPWLSASGEATQRDSRAASTLRRDASHQRAAWSLTLTQPLFNRASWQTLDQSKLIVADADIALAMAWQDLILRSAQAYFDVLSARDTLAAIEAEKAAIALQRTFAQRNFELGNATIIDSHEAQSRHDLIVADELQAQHDLDVAWDALAKLTGESGAASLEPLAVLPSGVNLPAPQPNQLDAWVEQAQSAALAVQRAQLGLRIAEQGIAIARSGHAPTLDFRASTGSASDLNRTPPYSGRGVDSVVGVVLNVPLYSGGLVSSRVTERVALAEKSRHDLVDARRAAVQNARRDFTRVQTGLARIRALEAGEASSLAALQANRTGYEIGVRVNVDVLDAQRQLYLTQRNLARARYDTLMAGLRLRAVTGSLSERDLQNINRLLQAPSAASIAPATSANESFVPRQSSSARTRMESPLHDRPRS